MQCIVWTFKFYIGPKMFELIDRNESETRVHTESDEKSARDGERACLLVGLFACCYAQSSCERRRGGKKSGTAKEQSQYLSVFWVNTVIQTEWSTNNSGHFRFWGSCLVNLSPFTRRQQSSRFCNASDKKKRKGGEKTLNQNQSLPKISNFPNKITVKYSDLFPLFSQPNWVTVWWHFFFRSFTSHFFF